MPTYKIKATGAMLKLNHKIGKYVPHQNTGEVARRLKQQAKIEAKRAAAELKK